MNIKLPKNVEYILDALEARGYRADIVGGSVRDAILGREIGDYDITTSALPTETCEVFKGHRIIETGLKHGTVSLLLDGTAYEITTYRTDGEYLDNRHPEEVRFVKDIKEDLARRDFTVNALAYSERYGLTDLFCGQADLNKRIIRAVGDPCQRFDEDALRILRALRFASVLDFEIEERTAKAAKDKRELLKNVSKERIFTELTKLLTGKGAHRILRDFEDILVCVLPGIEKITLPKREAFEAADGETRLLSLYALATDNCSMDFYNAMAELKTDKHRREVGKKALKAFLNISELDERRAALLLKEYGDEASLLAAKLGIMLRNLSEKSLACLDFVLRGGLPYRISDLNIKGDDVKSLGFKDAAIGKALDTLLIAVINGECQNSVKALLNYLANSD